MEESARGSDREVLSDGEQVPRAFLDALVSRLPDPAVVVDGELTVLAANNEFCDSLGRSLGGLLGTRLTALFTGVSRAAIERRCDSGTERLTAQYETADTDRWMEFTFERQAADDETVYLGVGRDVTERQTDAELLEQYERIFETIEDGIYTLNESFNIETVNGAIESMTGYAESELLGSNATLLADDSTIGEAMELSAQLQSGEREVGTLTTELETADGDTIPIETRFSPFTHCDGSTGQVGVVRSIADRRRFARTLASLHDSTRQLLQAGTTAEVAAIIDETATEVLELPESAVYLFDRSANVLRPAEASRDSFPADVDPIGPNDGPVWEVFVDDEPLSPEQGETYWPLGDHGVFYAASDHEDQRLRELVELLVSSAQAALARVDREDALRESEAEYRRQNDELRLLKQVNEIIRRVDRVLVEADTCAEIEQAVCDELTESQWFSFAWLSRSDGDIVEPRTWAGRSVSYLDDLDLSTERDGGPPAVRTARTGEPTVVDSISDDLEEPWRKRAISRDFQSALSVPLAYDDFLYGVLTVYADETGRFGEMLESVFVELGEAIANAIREIQSRQRQPTDSVVELDLSVASREILLTQLARRLDATVVCEGGTPSEGATTRMFVRIPDVDPKVVQDCIGSMNRVHSLTQVSEDGLYELVTAGPTLVRTLVDKGARLESLTATTTGVEVTVQLAAATDVREFIEQLDGHHPGVTLHARRDEAAHSPRGDSLRAELDERLTDRQLEVLKTAYLSGFFDWPRETTGEEVAEMLGVTQPTVNRHLRVSERKLLDLLLDDA